MKIRPATIEDAEALSRLSSSVQLIHAEAHPQLFKFPERVDFAIHFFTAVLTDPDIYIFLAEEERPIGYILLRVTRREENPFMYAWQMVYIEHISVLPEYQGKGIGKALIQQAEKLAEKEGLDYVGLDTWDFNIEAHEFFFSQGYQTFNLRMWKKLGE